MKRVQSNLIHSNATLIIVKPSLVYQWESEVHKFVSDNFLKVIVHYGENRHLSAQRLASSDIVITTYGVILKENACRLNMLIKRLVIRRTKEDIGTGVDGLDLPKRHEKIVRVKLDGIERIVYDRMIVVAQ
uniref:SNF2 N-terminal domain-containing protein n=1 Tax=Ditylenchus dipsaci TaxID=166011 RepID=A0A915E8N6_9BILA